MSNYTCPECGGGFAEPVEITDTEFNLVGGFMKYDADACPWCEEPINATRRNRREMPSAEGTPSIFKSRISETSDEDPREGQE